MIPTVDELLAAMQGHYDPQHPRADILRVAWLLARFDHWFAPRDVLAIHTPDPTSLAGTLETGTEALASIQLDLALLARDALIDRIARAVDGDEGYALAVDQLAVSWAAVADARTWHGRSRDKEAEQRLTESCDEYEQLAQDWATQPPGMTGGNS